MPERIYPNDHPLRAKRRSEQRQYKYMVTIRKHQVKDFVTCSQLRKILDNLLIHKLGWADTIIENVVYEIEPTYMQMHLHGILYSKRSFNYTRYTCSGDFRIHFRKVYDLEGAIEYLTKQVPNQYIQSQKRLENFYNHNYGFIEGFNIKYDIKLPTE